MKQIRIVILALALAALLPAAAFAADYDFQPTTKYGFYGSTDYAAVYGSNYNYGGPNVVDYLDPLAGNNSVAQSAQIIPGSNQIYMDTAQPAATFQYTDAGAVLQGNGRVGTLSIPKLGINFPVFDGTDTASMNKGVGHFTSTSYWTGNVCFAGHNRGALYNIGSIKNLTVGDVISYTTVLGTRNYSVVSREYIAGTDWTRLMPTTDNRLTLITCLADRPELRVCVQAVEIA